MVWAAFVFGLCVGSFLNVCIYRLPLSKSVVFPRSMCPACGHTIRARDNIPVLSFLLLRGRCRDCGARFSARYPLVELAGGAFAALTAMKFGLQPEGIVVFGLIAALIVVIFIDIDHRIIPDEITLPGIHLGFILSFFVSIISPRDSLIGYLLGGGILFSVAYLYEKIRHADGMGGGDIKLLAMIGTFIGWKGVLFTLFVASLTGSLAALLQRASAALLRSAPASGEEIAPFMKLSIPFGPFLAIGAITFIFLGPPIIQWYFGVLR
jgi:leader peptidase (prepilin peptidase)/N-methyltransferase